MVYAGGRPLWQISICQRDQRPLPVLSWSPTKWRKAEAVRDKVMRGTGTAEPFIMEHGAFSVNWRKPARIDEVNRMAQTDEVRQREGRG